MMRSLATVVAVEPQAITVSCQQETSCGHCASRDSCGTGIVSKAVPGRAHTMTITTTEKVAVGDVVEIGLAEKSMLSSALLVYLLPLLFLIVGTVAGQWWFIDLAQGSELGVIASAVSCAAIGLAVARFIARRIEGQSAYTPSLIRVLGAKISTGAVINAASKDSD
ncbi:transcriptional regulator [Photobacterium jeanii]|uniref:Transcriptional regulator n=1 Tax=Photobacterium jeanii TaxID=858640 RepID=A0A178K5N9_9GAMM|nr:SoxR reducing system RseC family protein [Photobacterium jeanii]OAN12581.1 transcriptional regulator [Photobacterium jeanii]PST86754.1 transcriptional regulator [Photobacterium jeanii]